MSKPDLRSIVDMRLDFIVQNVSSSQRQCHFTDGWGASSSDPEGLEGLQDCDLARYQLCARAADDPHHSQSWWDFSVCLFRNQAATDKTEWKKWSATVSYCATVTGLNENTLKECVNSPNGGSKLLQQSHETELKLNPDRAGGKTKSVRPEWVAINGKDFSSSDDWLRGICDAYTGSPKPTSCKTITVV